MPRRRAPEVLSLPGVRAVVTPGGDVLRAWSVEGGHQASSVLSVRADYEEASTQAEAAQARMTEVSEQLGERTPTWTAASARRTTP